jgi:hypothetical protein
MEKFSINGESDFITVTFDKVFGFPESTFHFGGYDLNAFIEIRSRSFSVKSSFYTTTGELFDFLQQLKDCNEKVAGCVNFTSYEGNLELIAMYDTVGHVMINGRFSEQNQFDNQLIFEFASDQTFISSSIKDLELIANKYGDMKGVRKNNNA